MTIEEKNNEGVYPIQIAILHQNRDALEALLSRGARLRSSTWMTAVSYHPDVLFVLLSKLLDDAGILFRRKRFEDAMHRLHYALNKCEICLKNDKLQDIHNGLMKVRLQVIVSMARVLRRQGQAQQAIDVCSSVDASACERARFESLLLRAKCHFDLQDIERAKTYAHAAVHLRPDHDEARHLLNTLMLPCTNIARL
ncbi:tetratricopeptide repeat protein [Dictyocaulus viviparus]|uniref:Tetratricopeptide repeat protein n=1 Tax=Dictyocaulus viviparus TaxID=29172 RepID=A0A0D8XBC8_DICVI|nr:tetratricopeptide repeat protein [Dictyocaulus viviparus]